MDSKEKSLKFFLLSEHYINMVTNTLEKMIETDNPSVILSNNYITESDFTNKTKYCDFSIIVALLFLFYHWAELILKGFLLVKLDINKLTHHNIEKLLLDFIKHYPNESNIIAFFKKYIEPNNMPSLLKNFFNKNNLTTGNFYDFFKYPLNKDFNKKYDYTCITHTDDKGVDFFKGLLKDINQNKKYIVKLGRKITS
jgi:hypothetical protein